MSEEFQDKSTEDLEDIYGAWLTANGFGGDEPVADVLHCGNPTPDQSAWLEKFSAAWKIAEDAEDAAFAADRAAAGREYFDLVGYDISQDDRIISPQNIRKMMSEIKAAAAAAAAAEDSDRPA